MNTKPNNKLLLLIIGFLLVTNIVMLVFLLNGRPSERRNMRAERKVMMTTFLQKEIGFSQNQLTQYDSLTERHKRKVRSMFEAARKDKEGQVKQLSADNFSDSSINTIAGIASMKQKEMEVEMFTHFKAVRSICTPAQLPKFDSLFYTMLNKKPDERKK
ncbi:Spy/CpxP family protein refolding chaperone [Ferruginibacter paludis]|uniref:Spy/CpxP family protein refolding chaperone n=1 Tax=Ferruginibacter paludis TaxID=1310417 RepID=UPI0025B2947F|nr:Spy/CpxP family protein refolding chaperone [Ferruginibacter paludis]MDN3658229.1 Spy/CpxP family protein refolding chaperone [Ferruginibacter paludis]